MNAVVIEHVNINELPEPWREKLSHAGNAWVTVRIEAEAGEDTPSAFGMWGDRQDLADVASHVRTLRAPRFTQD
jgi:hypothetical protein